MFKVGDEVVIKAIGKAGIITGFNGKGLAQYRSESGNGQCAVKNLTKVNNMFNVGDEVVFDGEVFEIIEIHDDGDCDIWRKHKLFQNLKLTKLKPRYTVEYAVIDNSPIPSLAKFFKTEQQAFDYINKPRVNVGERWKHSTGVIITVISMRNDVLIIQFKILDNYEIRGININDFLKGFTKCES